MESDLTEIQCVFRDIGSHKLIIFESTNILIRDGASADDMGLSDISNRIVNVLSELRARRFRFGFISAHTLTNSSANGLGDKGVPHILDALLSARSVSPDFWVAFRNLSGRRSLPLSHSDLLAVQIAVIARILKWYAVDKHDALFVSGTSGGARAAIDAGLTTFAYSSRDLNLAEHTDEDRSLKSLIASPVIADEQKLVSAIEKKFGSGQQKMA